MPAATTVTATTDAPTAPVFALRERPDFDPKVAGIPGDGSGIVLHTDPERSLTYTWYDISRRRQDYLSRERGYLVSRLSVTFTRHDGTDIEVAGLNVTHTTQAMVDEVFETPFHWADENTTAIFGFAWNDEVSPQKVWATAYNNLSGQIQPGTAQPTQGWAHSYSASDAPHDPDVLAAEIQAAAEVYAKRMRRFVRYLSTPFVDYAHVDSDFEAERVEGHPGNLRGTGIGYRMYVLAAQHLATHKKVLRASGLQSPEAQHLWERLVADPEVPTRKCRPTYWDGGPNKTSWCIDYTGAPGNR
jgi:hypothetical protein